MDFFTSLNIASSGLQAQSGRMRIIAENLANADSAATEPGGDPYRRRIPTFKAEFDQDMGATKVQLGRVVFDQSAFQSRFEPGHPAADEAGYVLYPNVNTLIEITDMREAQRTYEANLNVVRISRQMLGQTIDILRT